RHTRSKRDWSSDVCSSDLKRYSRARIARRPELAGRDIAATRRACRKFSRIPVAIVNFVEGTRFTPAKHQDQQSPHQYLLKPRAEIGRASCRGRVQDTGRDV